MAREPEDRYASVRALADDLEKWLADEPISAYRTALAQHEAMVVEHPEKLRYREALARTRSNLGNALHFLGRNKEAEGVHRTAITELQALVDQQPDNSDYLELLAVAYSNLGWTLRALNRKSEADEAYNESLNYYKNMSVLRDDCATSTIPILSHTMLFTAQGLVLSRSMLPARSEKITPDDEIRLVNLEETTLHDEVPPARPEKTIPHRKMLCKLEPGTLRWLKITDSVRDFFGPMDRLQHQTFLQFLHRDDRALVEDEFRQAAERRERHDFFLRIQSKSCQWHYMRIYIQARYDSDGTVNHFRCYLTRHLQCLHCDNLFRASLVTVGKRVRCGSCGWEFIDHERLHSEVPPFVPRHSQSHLAAPRKPGKPSDSDITRWLLPGSG